jgi:hypothetical protein
VCVYVFLTKIIGVETIKPIQPEELRKLLFVTGPRVAGRLSVTDRLINRTAIAPTSVKATKGITRKFEYIKILTTDSSVAQLNPSRL